MAKGSRLPCTEGVRVGVIPKAFTFLSMGTGEPDDAKVSCPVRGGTGRKGSNDLARGLPYLRSGFRQQLTPGVGLRKLWEERIMPLEFRKKEDTMINSKGIFHTHLVVKDLERSLRFYSGLFGMQDIGYEDGDLVFLQTPGGRDLLALNPQGTGGHPGGCAGEIAREQGLA